jgi:hypothetical protein
MWSRFVPAQDWKVSQEFKEWQSLDNVFTFATN